MLFFSSSIMFAVSIEYKCINYVHAFIEQHKENSYTENQ